MNCEQQQELISQFIDQELNPKDDGKLFLHLSTCHECRSFFRSTLKVRESLRADIEQASPKSLDSLIQTSSGKIDSRATSRLSRYLWIHQRSITMSVRKAVAVLALAICGSVLLSLFVFKQNAFFPERKTPTEYVISLPQVEVVGYYPIPHQQERKN